MTENIFRVDFYPHNWLTGTMDLTPEQRGVYIQIVSLIYANRGEIRNDPAWIGRAANCSSRLARSIIDQLVVLGKLSVSESGFITNSKAENVLKDVRTRSEHAAKMRRTQLEKDEERKKNNKIGSADKQRQVSVSVSVSDIEDTNVSSKGTGGVSAPELSMNFENIWNAYPGRGKNGATGAGFKGDKKTARLKFETIYKNTKEADRETLIRNIIAGCGKYASFIERADYPSKHLSTWLNAEGWTTDYGVSATAQADARRGGESRIQTAHDLAMADQTYRHLRERGGNQGSGMGVDPSNIRGGDDTADAIDVTLPSV